MENKLHRCVCCENGVRKGDDQKTKLESYSCSIYNQNCAVLQITHRLLIVETKWKQICGSRCVEAMRKQMCGSKFVSGVPVPIESTVRLGDRQRRLVT